MRIAWFTPYYSASAIDTYSVAVVDALQSREVLHFTADVLAIAGIRFAGSLQPGQ